MDKKYQVFVSSTYIDLVEERNQVSRAILDTGCIPAGMEQFPAFDEEQFDYIKRIIDYCDYYVLIIGGRYGSTDATGTSYTEKEYDYAVSKGINVLAFINSNPDGLPTDKKEADKNAIEKLKDFRNKVSIGRMCKMWQNTSELHGQVAISLMKTIQERPATGWVRANNVASADILNELNEQRKINEQLRREIGTLQQYKQHLTVTETDSLAGLDDEVTIHGTFSYLNSHYKRRITENWETTITWGDLFSLIAPYIKNTPNDNSAQAIIGSVLQEHTNFGRTIDIKGYDFQTIKIHFETLGLLTVQRAKTINGGSAMFWQLTDIGQQLMTKLRSVKKTDVKKQG
jgi:hypothetical protein